MIYKIYDDEYSDTRHPRYIAWFLNDSIQERFMFLLINK